MTTFWYQINPFSNQFSVSIHSNNPNVRTDGRGAAFTSTTLYDTEEEASVAAHTLIADIRMSKR